MTRSHALHYQIIYILEAIFRTCKSPCYNGVHQRHGSDDYTFCSLISVPVSGSESESVAESRSLSVSVVEDHGPPLLDSSVSWRPGDSSKRIRFLSEMSPSTQRKRFPRIDGRTTALGLLTMPLYCAIKAALGTRPASLSVLPISTPSKTFLGKFMLNLFTVTPFSLCNCWASSNRVVSAGRVFMMFPAEVWTLRRASEWLTAGFAAGGAAAAGVDEPARAGSGLPSRSAFACSALRRLSSLSASILALIRFLASMSSIFSWRFLAASLICCLRWSSSLTSWLSCVAFWRIFCLKH